MDINKKYNVNLAHGKMKSPIFHILIIASAVFFSELLLMSLLRIFYIQEPYRMIIDASSIVVLIIPALFLFVYKPLTDEIARYKETKDKIEVSHNMLLTVLDSLDAIVYVADIKTYEIIFLNKYARNIFGDAAGKICWKVLQTNQNAPCEFCSNYKLISDKDEILGMYAWEFKNTVNNHWYDIRDRAISWIDGRLVRIEIATDFTERKNAEFEKEQLLVKLQQALDEVKSLQCIVPICSYCKKIRNDEGYWKQVEEFISKYTGAQLSHGICPACLDKYYKDKLDD